MPGGLLKLNLINIGLEDKYRYALKDLGVELDDLYKEEKEQGLGMAGLGQFAYCTLESSLRCLRTSDHLVLRGGVANSRKSTSPRRCWTGASSARRTMSTPTCSSPSSFNLSSEERA